MNKIIAYIALVLFCLELATCGDGHRDRSEKILWCMQRASHGSATGDIFVSVTLGYSEGNNEGISTFRIRFVDECWRDPRFDVVDIASPYGEP